MSNLMTSMWTIRSGLDVSQKSLNATAHNLANVETEGYTRQQIMSTDAIYNSIGQNSSGKLNVGLGTATQCIRQLRNEFYDSMYRKENGRMGFYDAQYSIATDIESVFGEMEGARFQESIDKIWVSLQELSKDPESVASKTSLVNTAMDFLNRARDIKNQINKYQKELNTQVKDTVDKINEIGTKICELNKSITKVEAGNIENANDYRDTRNKLLDELSYLVDISYKEDESGFVSVLVEGTSFIYETSMNKMGVEVVDESSELLKPVWPSLKEDVYNTDKYYRTNYSNAVGYLKGLVMARGTDMAIYTDIPKKPVEPLAPMPVDYMTNGQINQTEYEQAKQDYNQKYSEYEEKLRAYESEVVKYNNTVDISMIMTVQSQFDNLIHGITTAINDVLAPNISLEDYISNNVQLNSNDTVEVTLSLNGVDTQISEMDLDKWFILDEENAPVGDDENYTMGEALFDRRNTSRYITTNIKIAVNGVTSITKEVRLYNKEDVEKDETLFTINNIEINKEIQNNYSKLPLTNSKNHEEYDYNGVVYNLISVWDNDFSTLTPNALAVYNFKEYYTMFMGNIGNTGNILGNMLTNQSTSMNQLEDARQNYMGVSSDEELSNLVKYQQSFNAAAKYYTAVNEMLEHLIEKLG